MPTTIKQALKKWEEATGKTAVRRFEAELPAAADNGPTEGHRFAAAELEKALESRYQFT